jgi:hypothetical protein
MFVERHADGFWLMPKDETQKLARSDKFFFHGSRFQLASWRKTLPFTSREEKPKKIKEQKKLLS